MTQDSQTTVLTTPRVCGIALFTAALALLVAQPARALYPYVEFPELVHTADVIMVGQVASVTPRLHAGGKSIVTDVTFNTVMLVHKKASAAADPAERLTLTFAGGQVGDRTIMVSDVPKFQVGQTFLFFSHSDGRPYMNPLVAGAQGLFPIATDALTGEWYPTTKGGHAITGVSQGRLQLSEKVAAIEGGVVRAAPISVLPELAPQAGDPADSAEEATRSANAETAITLEQFVNEIHATLQAPPPERRVLRGLEFEPAGPMRTPHKSPAEPELGGAAVKEGRKPMAPTIPPSMEPEEAPVILPTKTPVSAITPSSAPEEDEVASAGGSAGGGTRGGICYCGYFDLFLVMEQVSEAWWEWDENNQAMGQFNQFMDIYRYVDDDGSWGNNGDNEFAGYPSSAEIMNQYGQGWGPGAIAVTWSTWSGCNCCEIGQADVMFNPAFTWWQNIGSTLDQFGSGRVLYRPTVMHELGHSWGMQRSDCVEDYNYPVPSIMHAYYDDIIEDGWGIHFLDAYSIREIYDAQTGIIGLRDLGVESYYVSGGSLTNCFTDAASYNAGDPITLNNVVVENNSNFAVSGVRIRFFLSANNNITTSDYQMGSYWEWASFGAEAWSAGDYTTTIPNLPAGTYFVGVIVSANGAAYEGDALNYNNATYFKDTITVLAPTNNGCGSGPTIGLGTTTGTTGAASTDGSATCGSSNSSPDVWYRFVAPCTGTLRIDTCGSPYDTVVSVHSACTGTAGNELACDDDCGGSPCGPTDSCLSVGVSAGSSYRIRVSGYQGASGNFTLNLSYAPPANNTCGGSILVSEGTTPFGNCGATTDGGAECSAQRDIWYRYVASCTGQVTVSLCGSAYDTYLAVYDEWDCPALPGALVGCTDDHISCGNQSQMSFPATAGSAYLIRIGGYLGAIGSGTLTLTCVPSNDLCANAQVINNGTFVGTTASGAAGDGSAGCGNSNSTADVWYKWTAPCTGNLRVETCGAPYDTVLSVHTACPATAGNQIGCNDDCIAGMGAGASCVGTTSSCLMVPVTGGAQYLIRVSGFNGAEGQYTLRVTNAPVNDSCTDRRTITNGAYPFTTCGAFADLIPGCATGKDVWFEYVAPCTDEVTVSLCGSAYDTTLGVFEGDTCREPYPTLVVCNDNACGAASEVAFNAVAGSTYLIAVGGVGNGVGEGDLTISCGTGAPAASIVDAFSRKRCDLPVNINGQVQNADVTSEARLGGISDLYISFDVAPGGPGANPVTLYQQTGCPVGSQAAYVAYGGASVLTPFVIGNDLLLRFSPALENARTYLIELGPEVTSIAGQALEIRGLVGDVESSGKANGADRSAVVSVWTSVANYSCDTDLNGDARTNGNDRSIVVSAWTGGSNCAP